MEIIPQPMVTMEPQSISVTYGTSVNITCQTNSIADKVDTFVWYKDGAQLQANPGMFQSLF